jgi:hypothetical protein
MSHVGVVWQTKVSDMSDMLQLVGHHLLLRERQAEAYRTSHSLSDSVTMTETDYLRAYALGH